MAELSTATVPMQRPTARVSVDNLYFATVSGIRTVVRIQRRHPKGGWYALNLATDRVIKVDKSSDMSPLGTFASQLPVDEVKARIQSINTRARQIEAQLGEKLDFALEIDTVLERVHGAVA